MEPIYNTELRTIETSPIKSNGFILDIGGGGEGIIGKLNGSQVIAIDTNKRELIETRNDALKVVMDATGLKFPPKSFDVCTAFFSLMYIPKSKHTKIFEEVFRVLKETGRFYIWDVNIPENVAGYSIFVVNLLVKLPNAEIRTAYGTKWRVQNIEHFKELANHTGFKVTQELSTHEVFRLETRKY